MPNQFIHKLQETFFDLFIYTSQVLILLSALGLFTDYPVFFQQVEFFIRIYICLFLIWRFNPIRPLLFNKPFVFTSLDRKVAFSAGLLILTTTIIKEYLFRIKNTGEKYINNTIF